jgi:hypothetical protein
MDRPDHDFHVVGNEIVIDFAVPLPSRGEDDVLTELLIHQAAEIIRDRKRRGQPLDGIPRALIRARRGSELVQVAELDLETEDGLPDLEFPDLLSALKAGGYDVMAKFGDADEGDVLPLNPTRRGDRLAPIRSEIRVTARLAAGLRVQGIDPEHMTMAALGPGLLRLAGYQLTKRDEGIYVAIGGGNSTYVEVVAHEQGDYPELDESRITSFLIAFARSHTDRGLLLTDKYRPYEIFDKERANPRCRFVTRERLQMFVDTIALRG